MKYGRIIQATVGAPDRPQRLLSSVTESGGVGLHLAAIVRRSLDRADDVVEVSAWGVGDRTLSEVQAVGALSTLSAGYQLRPVVLASGSVVPGSVDVQREGKIRQVTWRISDGGISLRTVRVSRAWGITDSATVLDYLISESGLSRGVVDLPTVTQYRRGYVALGSAEAAIRDVVADSGAQYAVAGGVIDVWPLGATRQTRQVEISTASGMVGEPDQADAGRWRVRVLLEPSIRPGDVVSVRSQRLTGLVRAVDVEHAIDSGYDATYYTTVTGIPL